MGRPRKPLQQELREGRPGRRPVPDLVVVGARELERPAGLSPEAADFWDTVTPELSAANLSGSVDVPALELMAHAYARAIRAVRMLEQRRDEERAELGKRLEETRSLIRNLKRDNARRQQANDEVWAEAAAERRRPKRRDLLPIHPGELAAIAKLETTVGNLAEYVRLLEEGRLVALGSTGQVVEHPLVSTARQEAALVLNFARDFGLTPAARAKLALTGLEGLTLAQELDRDLGPSLRGRKAQAG